MKGKLLLIGIVFLLIFSCKEEVLPPISNFNFTVEKNEVFFNNISENASSFYWDFGDGEVSEEFSPKHIYQSPGNYLVKLKAKGLGGESILNKTVELPKSNTTALFSYEELGNGQIQLKNESKEATDYLWEIPHLSVTSDSKDLLVNFEFNGEYIVKLFANGFGSEDSTIKTIAVTKAKELAPHADFDFESKDEGEYIFINKSKNAQSFSWDFGDNLGKSNLENPSYTYQQNGSYKVRLTASGKGGTSTKDTIINVTNSYYNYTLENLTNHIIYAYNNSIDSVENNFKETQLLPGKKVNIKTKNGRNFQPFFKNNGDCQLTTRLLKIQDFHYTVSGFLYFYEIIFTGTSEPITIILNRNGYEETFENIKLPGRINICYSDLDTIEFTVKKNNVNGNVYTKLYHKEVLVKSSTISDPFASTNIKYNNFTNKLTEEKHSPTEWPCGIYNGNVLITGPRFGCFYWNKNGNKTYVDRDLCKCN